MSPLVSCFIYIYSSSPWLVHLCHDMYICILISYIKSTCTHKSGLPTILQGCVLSQTLCIVPFFCNAKDLDLIPGKAKAKQSLFSCFHMCHNLANGWKT